MKKKKFYKDSNNMRSQNFIMQRVFMPVGQGAFYIEKFNDGFTVVYDCGSYKNTSIVEENIENSILDKKIDLLVISHYHEDHINGLEYLFNKFDIKRMLMPYLDLTEKKESFIDADIKNSSNDFYKDFCVDPNEVLSRKFGKSSEIIFVYPEQNPPASPNEIDIQNLNDNINSGDKITYKNKINDYTWSYIPFNFQNTSRTKQFEKLTEHLNLDTIDEFKDYYIQNKDDFIKIYKKDMVGDINTNSLVLYSGVYSNIQTTAYSRKKSFSFIQNISGCLYLGDYDVKGSQKMKEFDEKYKSFYKEISTIQIPHHGSKHNYNQRLNFKPNIISVISAGINNKFEHPHNETLKQIAIQNGIVILVTEEEETKLTQSIYIR